MSDLDERVAEGLRRGHSYKAIAFDNDISFSTVWRIQAQLVADIAALHGRKAVLTREQMVFCLFRHTAAQAVRDLAVRAGERLVVQQVTTQLLKKVAEAIGVKIARRVVGKGFTRWLPVIGVVGVAGYAYYDTTQVAATTIEFFSREIELEGGKEAQS
jgi:hypothetical protein